MPQASAEPRINGPGLPEQWARIDPGRAAVVDGSQVLTYGEWDDLADRLAEALTLRGIEPRRACVRSHLSPEWFVIRLALSKLAWEHVAVNWRLTPREVRAILDDCRPGAVFFDDDTPGPLIAESTAARALPITVGRAGAGAVSFRVLVSQPNPPHRQSDPLCPVITYSSGTTGEPKGIRKLLPDGERDQLQQARAEASARRSRSQRAVRTLLTLPLHHGIGPRAARICHERGGTVYLLDRFDPVRALEIIDRERITDWKVVPTMLHRVRALGEDVLRSFDVSSIKALSVGSAPTPWPLKMWVCEYFGDVLFEAYGASEIGMVAMMPPRMHRQKPGSCGLVRKHAQVRVLGPDGAELPRGQAGELWIKTPRVITSYLNGSPLEADVLSPDGYFRTGDIGQLDHDDFLYIVGRAKDVIIAGGVNIFPAEIEQALMEHPEVLDAAVIGIPEEEFGEQVAAFCELRPGCDVSARELLRFTEPRLAPFKRPRVLEFRSQLPRNDLGKVRKDELRRPYWKGRRPAGPDPELPHSPVPPR
jgi:long-chain acyl-CoA synthetase